MKTKHIKIILRLIDQELEIYGQLPKKILEGSKTAELIKELQDIKKELKGGESEETR